MLNKKAFSHWHLSEGLEERNMTDASYDIAILERLQRPAQQ